MNEREANDQGRLQKNYSAQTITETPLEKRISTLFHRQTQQIHYTPQLRARMLYRLTRRQKRSISRRFAVALVLTAALMIALSVATSVFLRSQQTGNSTITYAIERVIQVAPELARGGHLISFDPSEQHFVYQPANQPGVVYSADLAQPVASNLLAMRDARDIAWSPDGTALVATIAPQDVFLPLLALVPNGQYMHLIGHDALAVSWSPRDKQQIVYAMQASKQTQMWSTTPAGQAVQLMASIPTQLVVQHMIWSPDGHTLALVTGSTGTLTKTALQQAPKAIYLLDTRTVALHILVAPTNFSIGKVAWSPDNRYLSYEQIDAKGNSRLQSSEIAHPQQHFSITPLHGLQGWSWSPDSQAIVYSDGGTLHTHTLQGKNIVFQQAGARLVSPFWRKDKRILAVQINHGAGQLTYLTPRTK